MQNLKNSGVTVRSSGKSAEVSGLKFDKGLLAKYASHAKSGPFLKWEVRGGSSLQGLTNGSKLPTRQLREDWDLGKKEVKTGSSRKADVGEHGPAQKSKVTDRSSSGQNSSPKGNTVF